jgi:hypothetical protein
VVLTSDLGRLLAREVDTSHWRVKAGPSCHVTNPPERMVLRGLNSEPVFVNVYGVQELIPAAYVAWRAGTTNRVAVPSRQAGNRFLGSLKGLHIRAPDGFPRNFRPVNLRQYISFKMGF